MYNSSATSIVVQTTSRPVSTVVQVPYILSKSDMVGQCFSLTMMLAFLIGYTFLLKYLFSPSLPAPVISEGDMKQSDKDEVSKKPPARDKTRLVAVGHPDAGCSTDPVRTPSPFLITQIMENLPDNISAADVQNAFLQTPLKEPTVAETPMDLWKVMEKLEFFMTSNKSDVVHLGDYCQYVNGACKPKRICHDCQPKLWEKINEFRQEKKKDSRVKKSQ